MDKFILWSKTIQGILITVAPPLLALAGVSFSADQGHFISQNIDAIISALGALWGVYGRKVATTPITFKPLN